VSRTLADDSLPVMDHLSRGHVVLAAAAAAGFGDVIGTI